MRFEIPETMHAVLLNRHGGPDSLEYRTDINVPKPGPGEVLIQVGAAAVNNTDINTRIGWYSKKIKTATETGSSTGFADIDDADASWSGVALRFPLIQGADCCGRIVAIGEGVETARLGQRVLVRNMLRAPVQGRPYECWTYGSDSPGSFAQYTVVPDADTWPINSELSDAELASFPCSYSTAELMIQRTAVTEHDTVLITGASGGVGSAAVQLAKCRGAKVIALTSPAKCEEVRSLGADQVIERGSDLVQLLGTHSVTVVVDLVGGNDWPALLQLLCKGGRYAVAGAIAGPLVELDLRTLYLNDLTFFGCTWQDDAVFENLIKLIEASRIRPVVSKVYPLSEIVQAQADFVEKRHIGKLVLVPPQGKQ